MKDFFGEFQKTRMKRFTTIVVSAFILAVSANVAMFQTDIGKQLQANVLGVQTGTEATSDMFITSAPGSDIGRVQISKDLKEVKELRFSLVYNPEEGTINDVFSENKNLEITKLSNIEGVMLINVRVLNSATLSSGDLLLVSLKRISKDPITLNLIGAQFVNNQKETFDLSSAGGQLK